MKFEKTLEVLVALMVVCSGMMACRTTSKAKLNDPKTTAEASTETMRPGRSPDPKRKSPATSTLIKNARILPVSSAAIENGYIFLVDGQIEDMAAGSRDVPAGVMVIDAQGNAVTPGLIDTHSHHGVYANPAVTAHNDGNEATRPTTPSVSSEDGFWPQDPQLGRTVASGVTTVQILPGSANLIGGRSTILKLHPEVSARAMRFPGAPQGLKMACGENPKRNYRTKGGPGTRMGNIAVTRKAFQKAWSLQQKRAKGEKSAQEPADAETEVLASVLDGDILVHIHCYRADEMSLMMDMANEYGFKISSFHHALEAYKIAPRLADEDIAVSTWADWWAFKMEAYDGIPYNAALVHEAGGRTIIHSDSPRDIRRLHHEAAKAQAYARDMNIVVDENAALSWITSNPSVALGIDKWVGTLEKGKHGDVVIWNSKTPLSIYARAEVVLIDGIVEFDRSNGVANVSDFETGHEPAVETKTW